MNQLTALDTVYRLYVNHFLPVQKLITKIRHGSKVKKVYDDPKTPFQRVLDSSQVLPQDKRKLRAIYAKRDVVELKCQIDERMDALTPNKQW